MVPVETNAWLRDPIYGSIMSMQWQVESLHTQMPLVQAEMVRLRMAGACQQQQLAVLHVVDSQDGGAGYYQF